MYVSICLCLYLYAYSYVGTWTFMCILTHALLLSPWEEILNSTREQFKRFILNGIVIISVLGLNYFYYTGTKNFTSVGFYQMYSRGFINLRFYDTCSNIFYHYFYWFDFLLTVNIAFFKTREACFWQRCLLFTSFLWTLSTKRLDFILIHTPHKVSLDTFL